MAWVIHYDNAALNHEKILIAGNDKLKHPCYSPPNGQGCHQRLMEKGSYFMADIKKVVRCEDYMIETSGNGDENFLNHHCFKKYPLKRDPVTGKYWEEKRARYAVYFETPSTIKSFSNNRFDFLRDPIIYFP